MAPCRRLFGEKGPHCRFCMPLLALLELKASQPPQHMQHVVQMAESKEHLGFLENSVFGQLHLVVLLLSFQPSFQLSLKLTLQLSPQLSLLPSKHH